MDDTQLLFSHSLTGMFHCFGECVAHCVAAAGQGSERMRAFDRHCLRSFVKVVKREREKGRREMMEEKSVL